MIRLLFGVVDVVVDVDIDVDNWSVDSSKCTTELSDVDVGVDVVVADVL